jgi:hypothetical protein
MGWAQETTTNQKIRRVHVVKPIQTGPHAHRIPEYHITADNARCALSHPFQDTRGGASQMRNGLSAVRMHGLRGKA